MLKKALFYLGLGSDEEYEQYDDLVTGGGPRAGEEATRGVAPNQQGVRRGPGSATVRPIMPSDPSGPDIRRPALVDSPFTSSTRKADSPGAGESAVRIVDDPPTRPSTGNPHSTSPIMFEEAPRIGERLKAGQPVIMNLQNAERSNQRRLLDFASGACYALGAKMERVADQVFLITPPETSTHPLSDAVPSDEGVPE